MLTNTTKMLGRIVLFACCGAVLMVFACGKDAPIAGFDLANPGSRGNIDSISLTSLPTEATFSDTIASAGRSPFLMVGTFRNVETQTLLKFSTVPDTVQILKAVLVLRTSGVLSDGMSKSVFTATVHRVTTPWEENSVTVEDFGAGFDPTPLGSAEILPVSSTVLGVDSVGTETVRFELDETGLALVQQWADTTQENNGFLINFQGGSFIKEFFSRSSLVNRPMLEMEVLNDSVLDTNFVVVSNDTYLARKTGEPPSGPLYVDNAFTYQSVIKFDLDRIPRESTINRIIFELNVQSENSFVQEEPFAVRIERLAEPYEGPGQFKIDSTFTAIGINLNSSGATRNSFTTLRKLFQQWITREVENHGILIRAVNPGRDVSRVALHSILTDSTLAPNVTIDFTTAPSGSD